LKRIALLIFCAALAPISAHGAPSCEGLDTDHLVRDINKLPSSIRIALQRQFPGIRSLFSEVHSTSLDTPRLDLCNLGDVGEPENCFMAAAPYGKQWAVAYGIGGFSTGRGINIYRAAPNGSWQKNETHDEPPCVLNSLWELAYTKSEP
jgi:hypothetical protein